MKRLLLAPIILVLIPLASCSKSPIPPGIEANVHKACLKAVDYTGCIDQFNKKNEPQKLLSEKEEVLLNELKKLPARMTRTSLLQFQQNVSGFVDALSLAKFENPDSSLVINASKLLDAFDLLYEEWKYSINNSSYSTRNFDVSSSMKNRYDFLFGGNNTSLISQFKFFDVTNNSNVHSITGPGSRNFTHASARQVHSDANDRDNIHMKTVVDANSTNFREYTMYAAKESAGTHYFNATVTNNAGCSFAPFCFTITEVAQ